MKRKGLKALSAFAVLTAFLIACLLFVYAQRRRDGPQTVRPRRAEGSAQLVTVKAGGNLQTAINNARYGDTIVLEAGATFAGPLILPDKSREPNPEKYITIRTSDLAGIPPDGERIRPEQHARSMPKIVAPNSGVAVATAQRAHHYKFIGIEFAPAAAASYVYSLIDLGASDYKSLEQFSHHLIFDRCYVHSTGLGRARRGFALNSAETSIINSHIAGFAGEGDETQGICGWNGPGPFHIVNNYIEGGGQNIMFGGADPSIPNLVPSDIEIRRNYLYKPAEWFGRAAIKAMIELKNARMVRIEGNLIEAGGPIGAFVFTVRNQSGTAPWSTLEDVEVTNNIVRHTGSAFSLLGKDNYHPSRQATGIRIVNNLIVDIGPDYDATLMAINSMDSVTVEHNTVQQTGTIVTAIGGPTTKFILRNNIVQHSSYGIWCERGPEIAMCFPDAVVKGNVIVDNKKIGGIDARFPRGNFFFSSFDDVGFVDYLRGDWRLTPKSKVKGKTTEGKDPGVAFELLRAAVQASDIEFPYLGAKKR